MFIVCFVYFYANAFRPQKFRIQKHSIKIILNVRNKTGDATNSLVSRNISTNHTFDFQNCDMFAFIHDRDKRRLIEASSILYFDTILRQGFYKISPSLARRVQNPRIKLAPFF